MRKEDLFLIGTKMPYGLAVAPFLTLDADPQENQQKEDRGT